MILFKFCGTNQPLGIMQYLQAVSISTDVLSQKLFFVVNPEITSHEECQEEANGWKLKENIT